MRIDVRLRASTYIFARRRVSIYERLRTLTCALRSKAPQAAENLNAAVISSAAECKMMA
jgi:hypothetical protein